MIEIKINAWDDRIFHKQYGFLFDTSFFFDDFRHLLLEKYDFFIENGKCFSFFLSLCFFDRANQISPSRLILYIFYSTRRFDHASHNFLRSLILYILFCLKEHVKLQGLIEPVFVIRLCYCYIQKHFYKYSAIFWEFFEILNLSFFFSA